MLIRRPLVSVLLLGVMAVSACTTTSEGDPLPAESTGVPTSSNGEELPFGGAPKVKDPLDTSRYEKDPCQSLTADQAESLKLPATGKIDDTVLLGIGCEWKNLSTRGYVQIEFIVDDPRGLSPVYRARKKFAYFEVLPDIEGYPAIARDGIDDRDNGYCIVLVGVADDMMFASNVQLSRANVGQKDPCQMAAQVAGMAVQTMKKEA